MQLRDALRTIRVLAPGLALLAASCQTPRGDVPARPAVSNAEYERAQLKELGCISEAASAGSSRSTARRQSADETVPPVPRSRESNEWPVPGLLRTRMTDAASTSTSTLAHPASPPTSQPVQKMGSTYFTPSGGTSQKIGSIMFNSDGTSGTLIGNKIMGR